MKILKKMKMKIIMKKMIQKRKKYIMWKIIIIMLWNILKENLEIWLIKKLIKVKILKKMIKKKKIVLKKIMSKITKKSLKKKILIIKKMKK